MKKGKNGKSKQNKDLSISENNNNIKDENKTVTKEVGTYKGFLVFDKVNNLIESDLYSQTNEKTEPILKDWLIIQHTKKTKSRFIDLFQEILENDKKIEEQKKSKENQSYEKTLLPNNIIEDIEGEEIKINENKNIINNDNEINYINESMKNTKLYKNDNFNVINTDLNSVENIINVNKINPNIINNKNSIINNNFLSKINNEKIINNDINNKFNFINNDYLNNNDNQNQEGVKLNNISNNNNIIDNNNILFNYNQNNKNNNPFNQANKFQYQDNEHQKHCSSLTSSTNSNYPSNATTQPSSFDRKNSVFSFLSNSSNNNDENNIQKNNNINNNINNNTEYFYFSNKNSFYEPNPNPVPSRSEKKFDFNIDIKKVIYLEDRRTTLMIKNIPNKFKRELLINIIDQNFKYGYDLFILPTDANRYKNFGYSFINFTCSYYIPYFFFLFNKKKWPNTNSQKVCEITYSKIQGRNNLLLHYSQNMIYKNKEANKHDISEKKYIIPNEYFSIFNTAFPNYNIEKYDTYFMTKMPFKY